MFLLIIEKNIIACFFILKNKYEMLDIIQSEIRYLAANKVNEAMEINYD